MWSPSNERYLDRRGSGDEFYLDSALKASAVLAGLSGDELADNFDDIDLADDDAASH